MASKKSMQMGIVRVDNRAAVNYINTQQGQTKG
jgi:hypothetical protein